MAGCGKVHCSLLAKSSASVPSEQTAFQVAIQKSRLLPLCGSTLHGGFGILYILPATKKRQTGEVTPAFTAPSAASDTHRSVLHAFHRQELVGWCHLDGKQIGTLVPTGQLPSSHSFVQIHMGGLPSCHIIYSLPALLPPNQIS